ncbi:GAL3ST1 [Bugula neritina]|uniref:GAL3ST1 n=1 Tax=Bugula neritina TaxID=10212 RepID=A0A7J7ISU2_BUGNE|nr:GAL3ST1 [Bugula neritina]
MLRCKHSKKRLSRRTLISLSVTALISFTAVTLLLWKQIFEESCKWEYRPPVVYVELAESRNSLFSSVLQSYASLSANTQDMGKTSTHIDNEGSVLELIEEIEIKFKLVMISDYVDESLILLKNLLNLSLRDIFYMKPESDISAVSSESDISTVFPESEELSAQSQEELQLYTHFNRTFWDRVKVHQDFQEELNEFQHLNQVAIEFCNSFEKNKRGQRLFLNTRRENDLELNGKWCRKLQERIMY